MADREIACHHCGIQFLQKPGRGRHKKYCSARCRATARYRATGARPIAEVNAERRKAAEVFCETCGTGFVRRNGTNAWRFCSRACSAQAQRKDVNPLVKQAEIDFAKWAKPNRNLGFATRIKALRLSIARKNTSCLICGDRIDQPYSGLKRYCSRKCRRSTPAFREAMKARRKRQRAAKRAATVETVSPLRVFMRDGWRCHLCGGMTDRTKRGTLHPNAPELDHIVPLSKGGEHSYRNTACAHKRCNAAKSDRIIGQPSLLAA